MIIRLTKANFSSNNIGQYTTEPGTLTFNVSPSNASWTLTCTAMSPSTKTGTGNTTWANIPAGSTVSYEVSLSGYNTQKGSISIYGNTSKTITLSEVGSVTPPTPEEPGTGGDSEGGTLITSGSLTGTYLHENTKFAQVNGVDVPQLAADSSKAYFVMRDIPVNPNTTYRINKARACWYLDVNKQPLTTKYVNLTSEVTNFTFTTPANCKYLRIAFKYVDIKPNAVEMVQQYTYGEGVETYLKDTTAEFRDDWAVETNKTEPSSYSGYFIYHLIPVTANNKYKIVNARLSIWYDSNKQFIKQDNFNINSTSATTTDWSHVAPSNAAYLTICVNKNDTTKDEMVMIEYPCL